MIHQMYINSYKYVNEKNGIGNKPCRSAWDERRKPWRTHEVTRLSLFERSPFLVFFFFCCYGRHGGFLCVFSVCADCKWDVSYICVLGFFFLAILDLGLFEAHIIMDHLNCELCLFKFLKCKIISKILVNRSKQGKFIFVKWKFHEK